MKKSDSLIGQKTAMTVRAIFLANRRSYKFLSFAYRSPYEQADWYPYQCRPRYPPLFRYKLIVSLLVCEKFHRRLQCCYEDWEDAKNPFSKEIIFIGLRINKEIRWVQTRSRLSKRKRIARYSSPSQFGLFPRQTKITSVCLTVTEPGSIWCDHRPVCYGISL